MGHWEDKLRIYSQDFAYTNSTRVRMANGNIADTTAKTFAELLSGPTVDVYVGKDKQHWSLHRNLLCHHSEWMQSELLPGEVKKKSENKLELPDDEPSGFELFVKWLYQGRLEDVSDLPEKRKWEYAVSCQKLYLLCDRFGMPQLKNLAIDQYRKGLAESRLVPDAEEINEIYRRSPQGSAFRHLITKIAARQIMDPDSQKNAESYRQCFEGNPDFAIDLVNAIKSGTGGILFDDPTEGDECEYHDHTNGPNCHVKSKNRQGPPPKSPPKPLPHRPPSHSSTVSTSPPSRTVTRKPSPPDAAAKMNGINGVNGINFINAYNSPRPGKKKPPKLRSRTSPQPDENALRMESTDGETKVM